MTELPSIDDVSRASATLGLGASHGYRMFECDVKLSADGVPFLLHDATLTRTTNASNQALAQVESAQVAMKMVATPALRYLNGYPADTLAQVQRMLDEGRVGSWLTQRHPQAHRHAPERSRHRRNAVIHGSSCQIGHR